MCVVGANSFVNIGAEFAQRSIIAGTPAAFKNFFEI
jgi:carbonic anhydrase/acetyltransferase-like protein (isoleucine patch superfamily)